MNPEKQRKIARKGGKTISADRKYMSKIGRKGGLVSGKARNMAKKLKEKSRKRK